MASFKGEADYRHDTPERTGILLVNLGTPDAPTTGAVRRYLRQFLFDPRVIELPRLPWWLLLQFVLVIRSPRSAHAYKSIWTSDGSPLLVNSRRQMEALQSELGRRMTGPFSVSLGMRYGNPSIPHALEQLRRDNVRRLLVLPLYPQYSATTTASVFDAVSATLKRWRWIPELRFVTQYHDLPGYISAVANSIREQREKNGSGQLLLFSFHGLPQRYLDNGDPYHCQCQKTARLVAEQLGLETDQWLVSFQSRSGREKWLQPYTDETLSRLVQEGMKNIDIVCPGFSTDCLETLEEIVIRNNAWFLEAGGTNLNYIPALNDRGEHVSFLGDLSMFHMQGWKETLSSWNKHKVHVDAERAQVLAGKMGANK